MQRPQFAKASVDLTAGDLILFPDIRRCSLPQDLLGFQRADSGTRLRAACLDYEADQVPHPPSDVLFGQLKLGPSIAAAGMHPIQGRTAHSQSILSLSTFNFDVSE